MTLEKWKRNEIYEAVKAAGLSPETFSWDDGAEPILFRHPSSGAHFVFGGVPGFYATSFVAGDYTRSETRSFSWQALMQRVRTWLSYVKLDIETPDLWDQLRREAELLGRATDEALENTHFAPDERDEIVSQLNEFREYATKTFALSEEHLKDLNSKVDYLIEATSRLGRKDWLNACIGALMGLIVVAALPPDVAHHCLQALWSGIAHFFGDGRPNLGSG